MKSKFNKVIALVLSMLMTSALFPAWSYAVWDGKAVSEPNLSGDVYSISNESELAWFANEVNGGDNSICAILTEDIDVSGTSWIQIGSGNDFLGTFDGNGKTITYEIVDATAIYRGLFNTVGENGVVKNLNITGSVTVKTARNYHGGVAGLNKGTITGCTSSVTIEKSALASSSVRVTYAGGIAGKNTGLIENCTNNGNVNVVTYAAGIVGENNGGSVINCTNNGNVTATNVAGYAGGIAGAVTANAKDNVMNIKNCVNNGVITGGTGDYGYAAGIVAQENVSSSYNGYDSKPVLNIDGCVNSGTLTGGNTEDIIAKQGSNCTINITEKTGPSQEDIEDVENASEIFGPYFKLIPVFGKDTNVLDIMNQELAKGDTNGVTISLKSTGDTNYVAENGDITYFYEDPDSFQAMWFKSIPLVFVFEKNGAEKEYSINAVIHWDADKVVKYLEENVLSAVTQDVIKGENSSLDCTEKDLVLPKTITNKAHHTLISWTSSDTSTVSVSDKNQTTADTLFNPYVGVVKAGKEDKHVTLTATFNFQKTSYDEAPIVLKKSFDVTIKAVSYTLANNMQQSLDENYTSDKLLISGTKTPIDASDVRNDIQLPIPRNTGIENYNDYTFTVTSSNTDVIEVNSYRAVVYRPLPGEEAKEVTLTVTMTNKNYDLSVSKDITVTVSPLSQEEIDSEIALMEMVKAAYFDGLNNGANPDKNHITENLSSFFEARYDRESDSIVFAYTNAEKTGNGIIPVSIDESRPSEYWDRFYTTNKKLITYENLIVTRGQRSENVTISSCLSSETFAKYAQKYPENSDFAKLYRQNVSVTVTVVGTDNKPEFDCNLPIENGAINVTHKSCKTSEVQLTAQYIGDYAKIVWSSSNNKVTVDENGLVSYKGLGTQSAVITAEVYNENGEKIAENSVTVTFKTAIVSWFERLKETLCKIIETIKGMFGFAQ